MRELEKILEEIDGKIESYKENPRLQVVDICYGLNIAKRIIRKHMNENDIKNSEDLISRQALLDDFRNTITENSGTFDWLNMIARQRTIKKDADWISAEERMPTKEECKNNWFWITIGESNNILSILAQCEWEIEYDKNGKDISRSVFYIDRSSYICYLSPGSLKAWKIVEVPEPYSPKNKPEDHYPEWMTKILGKFDKRV